MRKHVLPLLAAIAVQVLIILALARPTRYVAQENLSPPLWMIRLPPVTANDDVKLRLPDLAPIEMTIDPKIPLLNIIQSDSDLENQHQDAWAGAPRLLTDGHSGIESYVKQSGLIEREGATVVLRIEVLITGEPGRVEVDKSSGSKQVDNAAVAFARSQRWYSGRANGNPQAMWIRWAVRLQA